MCNVGKFPALEFISWGPHSSLERERKFDRRLFTSFIKREIRHFHVVSREVPAKKCTNKKRDAGTNLLFCLIRLLLF